MVYGRIGSDREERINYDRMRKYRVERVREQMDMFGWGTLITFDETNIRYLTGFGPALQTQEAGCVIFPRNGEPYLYMAGAPLTGLRNNMPWLEDRIRAGIRPRPYDCVTIEDCQNVVREVANVINEHGLSKEPLGIEGSTSGVLLQDAFKSAGINAVHDTRVMGEARQIKNEDEIECMKIATVFSEACHLATRDTIRPGVTPAEVIGACVEARFRLGDDGGYGVPFFSSTVPMMGGGTIKNGDLMSIESHGSFQGYRMCYFHVFCCGRATAEQKELYAEGVDMVYAAMSAIKPGNTALDVIEKWPSDPRLLGADNWDEVGHRRNCHGIGIGQGTGDYARRFHPGTPRSVLEEWTFEENMALAIEVWNGRPGKMKDTIQIEEDIIITKDGCERLAKLPFDELTECGV